MVKNRYDDALREGNQLIIDLTPSNYVLRIELASEIKKIANQKPGLNVLELGVGEGDLTKYILGKNSDINLDALDVSQDMIDIAKKNLDSDKDNTSFICQDALEYLNTTNRQYDIICSAWTLHNFPWEDKTKVFTKSYLALNKGGCFLLMDKLYPENKTLQKEMLKTQTERYRYLSETLEKEIIDHEDQDLTDRFRMEEKQTIDALQKAGFKEVEILDRVERDVLLVAKK